MTILNMMTPGLGAKYSNGLYSFIITIMTNVLNLASMHIRTGIHVFCFFFLSFCSAEMFATVPGSGDAASETR